jgi:hypothetical protein
MATHKITGSELRGLIKEALDETAEEIVIDDERARLASLGYRRTPAQDRRYAALLEAKLHYTNEAFGVGGIAKAFGSLFKRGAGAKATEKAAGMSKDKIAAALVPAVVEILSQQSGDDAVAVADVLSVLKNKAGDIQKQVDAKKPKAGKEKEEKAKIPGFGSATEDEAKLLGKKVDESRRLIRRR